ncbi:LysR family transcriptional regulator [Labrys monachus]|uniref:DNA-binding transcriptional LysR family regulator n=1 Tax=Labrys monachus TaxID=217067 RepID=A0ABU0FA72_9HYPH|nr:LysR family transcriptional regulator [Labrys monachus]MDQ0391522.1 DNA-binding transcriptional LysR family regulator [Labrys monachus]
MRSADLGLMLSLDVLLEEANVTRAASRLAISQPALSAQLARLRELFGDPLLVPASTGRGMVATPRALAMKGALHTALANLQALTDGPPAFDPQESKRSFRIVADDNAAIMVGAGLVARARDLGALDIRIACLHPNGRPICERLESGEADLALGSGLDAGEGLIRRSLFEDRFVTAQRKGHPRGDHPLDLDGYCRCDHLIVSAEGGFTGTVDRLLYEAGRHRRVTVSVQNYALVPEMLVRSDLLCTLPSRFLDLYADRLDLFETPIAQPRFVLAAFWHARVHEDPANVWLRERLFEVVGPSGPA